MATQWNYAANGHPVGLRYESLPFAMRACDVKRDQRDDVIAMVQTLEHDRLNRSRNG